MEVSYCHAEVTTMPLHVAQAQMMHVFGQLKQAKKASSEKQWLQYNLSTHP